MRGLRDAVVVGGGPAGLAFALAAARRGLSVTVLERRDLPADKACGEGVLPAGVRALDALGVLPRLSSDDASAFREIRWIDRDGAVARLALPAPGGLSIRRIALSAALAAGARAAGAEIVDAEEVLDHRRDRDGIVAVTERDEYPARVLVAADGLGSPVRRREALDVPIRPGARRRFGLRRHFAVPPWAAAVEVHFGAGAEAYVTPVGERRVGVAFLFDAGGYSARWDASRQRACAPPGHPPARSGRDLAGPFLRSPGSLPFDELLSRFPVLERLLAGAPHDSVPRGAGPLARRAAARTADRLVLLGDAAGYVDALTGEGLSIAFGCAMDLAALLPDALAAGAGRAALWPYEAAWRRRFLPYWAWTRVMLGLARRPGLRRRVLGMAAARPAPFERLVAAAVG